MTERSPDGAEAQRVDESSGRAELAPGSVPEPPVPQAAAPDAAAVSAASEPQPEAEAAATPPARRSNEAQIAAMAVSSPASGSSRETLVTWARSGAARSVGERAGRHERYIESVTDALSLAGSGLSLEPSQLSRWSHGLRERKVLVLSSHSRLVLNSALHQLAREFFARRLVLKYDCAAEVGALDSCCELPSEQGDDEDTIVVVDACSGLARFLDALFADTAIGWDIYRGKLLERRRHLLVLVSPEELASRTRPHGVPLDDVPFAPALMRSKFDDEQRARELCAEFERQAERGRWGATASERCRLLEDMPSERIAEALRTQVSVSVAGDVSTLELGVDPLLDTVLFVATYFPDVGASDFQDLVLGLVGDQEDPLSLVAAPAAKASQPFEAKPEPEVSPPSAEKEREAARRIRRKRTTLAERWRANNHQLLARAGLRVGPSNGLDTQLETNELRRSSVGFFRGSHADYMAKKFTAEHHFFYLECFDKLRARGVLMHPSQAIVDAFVKLAVAQAAANPQRHGRDWLLALIEAAGPQIDGVVVEGEATAEHLAIIRRMLDIHQGRHAFIYDRVCSLLRGMLGHQGLRGVVEETLEQWCSLALYPAVLEIVEGLVHAPNFYFFRWLRRVVDEGSGDVRERALAKLRWFACGAPRRSLGPGTTGLTLSILQECREWAESSVANRPSGQAGVLLTAAIGESVLVMSPLDPACADAPPAGIFGWLSQSSAPLDALPGITSWLLSARLGGAFGEDEDQYRLGVALFWRWFTPDCVSRHTGDGGDAIRHQLVSVWQDSVATSVGDGQFPGAALFQIIVLSDAAIRLKASGRFEMVLVELARTVDRQRIRVWLLLLQAMLLSLQKVLLALAQAHPKLSVDERRRCKATRERCASVRDEWRELHNRLKQLRSVTVQPASR